MTTLATEAVAAQCRGTPGVQVLDNRGLAVRALQYNRRVAGEVAEPLMTRQRYTATGQLFSSLDPRLGAAQQLDPTVPPNFRYQTSLSGRPLHSQSQDAGTTVQLSDVEGGPIWQRGSRQQCTRWRYDALHRPTLMVEQAALGAPERISERYTYGDGSAVAAAANGRGRLLVQHDTAGVNETPRYSLGGQVQRSVRRLLRAEVPASDWQGEAMAWETDLEAQAYTSQQGFDALGRVAWSLDARGNRQHAQFNGAGQLLSSQLTLAGQSSPQTLLQSVRYSAAGQVQREVAGNGVVSDYTYEAPTQRLNRLTVSRPAQSGRATLLQDLRYDYDPVGNILAIGDAAQPTRYHHNQRIAPVNQYQYDALYQLLSASGRENAEAGPQGPGLPLPDVPLSADPNRYSHYTRAYTYDRGGNLTRIRHQGRNNYTQDLVVAPTSNRAVQQTGFLTPGDVDGHFDAAGNLRQLAPGQPLSWDDRNQLQAVRPVQRAAGPDDREWYRYDGGGQRVQKTSVSQTSGTQRQAEVIYLLGLELRRTTRSQDGVSHLEEDLQVIRGQAAGRAQVRVLHWETGQPADIPNDQRRYSLDNQIGSSLLELDQAADLLTLEEYFPFGGTAVWSGKTASETQYKFVRYSGKERDATGLYYYGFRYYAPWLGRWLNPDPAGTIDGLNLYKMVNNNPVVLSDADGLMWRSSGGDGSRSSSFTAAEHKLFEETLDWRAERGEPLDYPAMFNESEQFYINYIVGWLDQPAPFDLSSHSVAPIRSSKNKQPAYYADELAASLQTYRQNNAGRFADISKLDHKMFPRTNNSGRPISWQIESKQEVMTSQGKKMNFFNNCYGKGQWKFSSNYRFQSTEATYYAADVAVEQYTQAARAGGFFGHLPKMIIRDGIDNRVTEGYLRDFKHLAPGDYLKGFMEKTVNGKSSQRVLDVFGMEAYAMKVTANNYAVKLSVRKKTNIPIQGSHASTSRFHPYSRR